MGDLFQYNRKYYELYWRKTGEGIFPKKYKDVLHLSINIGGPTLYSEDEIIEIYRRCLEQDCFWQDLPDVVEHYEKWEKEMTMASSTVTCISFSVVK